MKKIMLTIMIAFLMFLVSTSFAEPIKLKFATMDPAQTTPIVKAYQPWLDRINKASDGTLNIEVYPGGSLGRDPRIQLKLVTDGVADLAFIVPAYTPGRFPDDEVFDLPFTATNGMEAAIASNRLFKRGLLGGYDDVHFIAHYTTEIYYLHSTYPVRVPADLKGHKLRAINKSQSEIFNLVGAIGIGMPGPQMAENLSRGVIDGVICDNSAIFTFRVADVAHHHLLVPFGVTGVAMVMNKQRFESLPPKAKAAINKHGEDIVEMFVKAIQGDIERGMAKLKADPKYTIVTPTDNEMKLWKDTLQPLTDAWVAESPRRAKLFKAYQEELERIRSGG